MARIVLGVTGSVAAVRTPDLYDGLRRDGHSVRVVATEASLHFFDPADLAPDPADPLGGPVFRDRDEWPDERWKRADPVLHIELRRWADLLLIAPLDANTLAKFAGGLADNLLTCLFRAWDFKHQMAILAPAMNTAMWEQPVTLRQLRQLIVDYGDGGQPHSHSLDTIANLFDQHAPTLRLAAPIAKQLACGDVGMGAMAEVASILAKVRHELAASGL